MHRFLIPLLLAILLTQPSHAIPISTFLRQQQNEQRAYAAGGVSMLAFTEGMAKNETRMNCITGWYRGKGEEQLFAALQLDPAAFKTRFGFDRDGDNGHVELVLMRLANEACPK
jgi:hypothetical protein